MSKKVVRKEVYKFKKGEKIHLDTIYDVQGIGGNNWWDSDDPDDEDSDDIIITRDMHFVITFYE